MLPEQTSAGRASGGTGLEANLNRKANGLALEDLLWDFTYLCWNLTNIGYSVSVLPICHRWHERKVCVEPAEIPVHHKLQEYLDAYLEATKLSEEPASPLFRSTRGRSRELGTDGLSRKDAWAMLKRRLRDAGLSTIYSNHSFRAAGITNYLENDGTLEMAQRIAGHADSRTTKFYDRRGQKVLSEDMERIRY
jgi:hypothetical protein